jgi:acylpyruvate hydrolase
VKILSFDEGGIARFGVRIGERVLVHPDAASPFDLIGEDARHSGWAERAIAGLTLLPPVPRPGKIICIGLNYRQHAAEGGNAIPDYPAVFLRSTTSLLAPGAAMLRPVCSEKLDYEAELAVIIGARATRVSVDAALGYVAGYACFNDGSVRDYQRKSSQWTIGKNFDATGGFGPELVTADELPAGARGLRIVSRVNGVVMQDSNTDDMIFDVATLVSVLSQAMTLEPGDVIATGTPAGVGYARNPPQFLQAGDRCEVEIEGLGVLSNHVADAVPAGA